MTSKNKRMNDGFSLIEVLIAIAIVGIVMSGVILLISYSTNMMRKTSNSVALQNESKDGMLHLTTHVQEGSDAAWDATNRLLTVAKKIKSPDGETTDIEVNYYWLDTSSVASGGGASVIMEDGTGVRGSIYYSKTKYPQYAEDGSLTSPPVTNYLLSNGDIDFDKLKISDLSALETPVNVFIKNVTGFNCKINERVDAVKTLPVSSSAAMPISGKSVIIQLVLRNHNGDAKFNNVKEVYLRNQ